MRQCEILFLLIIFNCFHFVYYISHKYLLFENFNNTIINVFLYSDIRTDSEMRAVMEMWKL